MDIWLALHIASCFFMAGLIWVIQLIHYPAFAVIEPARFGRFHQLHSRALMWIAGPAMIVELATAIAIAALYGGLLWSLNLALTCVLWLATFLLIVPLHNTLSAEQNPDVISKMCSYNWIRTVLWTGRSLAFVIYLVWSPL